MIPIFAAEEAKLRLKKLAFYLQWDMDLLLQQITDGCYLAESEELADQIMNDSDFLRVTFGLCANLDRLFDKRGVVGPIAGVYCMVNTNHSHFTTSMVRPVGGNYGPFSPIEILKLAEPVRAGDMAMWGSLHPVAVRRRQLMESNPFFSNGHLVHISHIAARLQGNFGPRIKARTLNHLASCSNCAQSFLFEIATESQIAML